MKNKKLFEKLWEDYTTLNPSVLKVYHSFTELGETVKNDHIAFRTFNDKRINIEVLSSLFKKMGYVEMGEYYFEQKKLKAKHYEIPGKPEEPKVFISELELEKFDKDLQHTIDSLLDSLESSIYTNEDLILSGNIWGKPSYSTYLRLKEQSEYAAWVYVFGFRANHFTVNINHLKTFKSIEEVNLHIKKSGFTLNSMGGEIKGKPEELLQQSSIMAESVEVEFQEGHHKIPGCYYEFAYRYKDKNNQLFNGFIAKSADKIFESTNERT